MKRLFVPCVICVLFSQLEADASVSFAIDPASPSVDGNVTPDDVLAAGPVVAIQGTTIGLVDGFSGGVFDNLNALSYGKDPLGPPIYFSVDRVAVGASGSAVNQEAQPGVEEAAGDVFRSIPPVGSNTLHLDEEVLGLTPGFFL